MPSPRSLVKSVYPVVRLRFPIKTLIATTETQSRRIPNSRPVSLRIRSYIIGVHFIPATKADFWRKRLKITEQAQTSFSIIPETRLREKSRQINHGARHTSAHHSIRCPRWLGTDMAVFYTLHRRNVGWHTAKIVCRLPGHMVLGGFNMENGALRDSLQERQTTAARDPNGSIR